MTQWQTLKLGKVVSIKTGKIDANKAVENGKYPFFTCAKEVFRIDEAPYEGKVVLVAGNGDLNVKYYEGKFNAYQRTYFLTSLDESSALPKYIYFFMEHYLQILRSQSIGTTVKYIKMENLSDAIIPLPPIDEQLKIVELIEDYLTRLEIALADVKQAKIKAIQFRRSLLQSAFMGNLVHGGTPQSVDWQTKKVGELADTQLGKMLNKGKQTGKYAKPYLRTDNVHWGRFDLSEIKEMDILPEERDKYLATKGDLLMCEGGASGRTSIWTEDYDISFQNHVHRIRPKDSKEITPKYLLYYFEWFIKNGFASDLIKGVTISSLSQSGLRSIEVSYPRIDEQQKIVEILEDHLSRLEASVSLADLMEKQSTGLRRSILQAAFTGQLRKEAVSV